MRWVWHTKTWRRVLAVLILMPVGGASEEGPPPLVAVQAWPTELVARAPRALTLEACVWMAVARDYDIQLRRLGMREAEAAVSGARGAFDPRVFGQATRSDQTAAGGVDRRTESTEAGIRTRLLTGTELSLSSSLRQIGTGESNDTGRVQIRVSQPLLRGGGTRVVGAGVERAERGRELARLALAETVMDSILDVENRYWSLVAARERVTVQEESLAFARELESVTRMKLEAGLLAESDVVEAQAAVSGRRISLLRARESVRSLEDELKERLALLADPATWTTPLEPVTTPVRAGTPPDELEALRTALWRRPDVQQARLRLADAGLDVAVARNRVWPRLDLVARGGRAAEGSGAGALGDAWGGRGEEKDWSVGLEVEVPLGNREARAARTQAEAARERQAVRLQQLELRIVRELRRAVDAVRTAQVVVEATAREVELEELKLDNEQAKLELGTSTTDNVVRFIESLNRAELGRVQALTDYNQALARLARQQGITLERYGVTLDEPDVE